MQYVKDTFSSSRNIAVLTSVTALGAAISYQMWRKTKLKIVGEFKPVASVGKIYIYPIKSLPGVEVESAFITDTGLSYGEFRDRSFILVKEESGIFITMRQEPSLALLKLSLSVGSINVDVEGMPTLKIPLKKSVEEDDIIRSFRCYGQDISGVDCGDQIGQWFNEYLGKSGFRLIQFMPDFKPRKIINNILNIFSPGKMLYHDDSTYLILSQASIDDLNSRLEEKISYKNFRPNFLLVGCEAYAEDNMKYAKVGDATLLFTTQCPRCILTTVNPETGIRTDQEPLTTLKTYRLAKTEAEKKQYGKSPLFGIYMGVREEGNVRTGDSVSGIAM